MENSTVFRDCFYLIKEKRPKGWKANQDIQERVDAKLRNPRVKEAVDRALARATKQSPPPRDKKDTSETDTESMDRTFVISTFTTLE